MIKKKISILLGLLFLIFSVPLMADDFPFTNFFDPSSLILPREGVYKQVSSHDKMFLGAGDFISINPKEKVALADIKDTGIITNFWLTIDKTNDDAAKGYPLRKIILRMYWDGEKNPSVEAPAGDFFGVGFAKYVHYTSLLLGMSSGGFYSYFPMPFEKSAKIEIENLMSDSVSLWYSVGYQAVKKLPKNALRFHAKFRRERKTKRKENYLILDAKGQGHFVGCLLSMQNYQKDNLLFLEGDEFISVDDDKTPSVLGTGTEDYFLSGFYFNKGTFAAPFHGLTIKDNEKSRISAYRFRVSDAISFKKSIHVEIEHGLTYLHGVGADYSSVAYWYQSEPHAEFAPPITAESDLDPME